MLHSGVADGRGGDFGELLGLLCLMVLSSYGRHLLDPVLQQARRFADQHEDGISCEHRGVPFQNDWLVLNCTCIGLDDHVSHDGLSQRSVIHLYNPHDRRSQT